MTDEELARLPPSALVAFAARCAERVLPLFERWEGATEDEKRVVAEAITVGVTFARGSVVATGSWAVRAAAGVARAAHGAGSAEYAAQAAERAAVAAAYAARAVRGAATVAAERAAGVAAEAARVALEAARSAPGGDAATAAAEAARADFEELERTVREPGAAVPPEFFERPIWSKRTSEVRSSAKMRGPAAMEIDGAPGKGVLWAELG